MVFTSLIVSLYEGVPARFKGGGIGMYRTFMDLGGFLGPPFFMLILSSTGSHMAFLSAIVILALNIGLLITTRGKSRVE